MKLRNLLFIGIAVLLAFSSCKDNAVSIVGTWKYDRVEVPNNAFSTGLINSAIQEYLGDFDIIAVFKEDGTYTTTVSLMGENRIDNGVWSLENGRLTIDGQVIEHTLSRNRLSLHTPTWLLGQLGELFEMFDNIPNLNLTIHFDRQ